jgi:hypothetical protein
MSESGDTLSTVNTDDGFSVSSTHETQEQLSETHKPEPPAEKQEGKTDDDLSEAASKLGKKGGETTAAKRAAEAKEQTEAKPEDAPAANEAEKAEKSKKGNPRHDPTARVAEATREAAEARREAAAVKAELERLRAERAAKPAETKQPSEKATEKANDGPPQEEDFAQYKDYVAAAAKYEAKQELKQYIEHQQQRARFEARNQVINDAVKGYVERINEAKKGDPTFVDRTGPLLSKLQPSFLKDPAAPLEPVHVISDEILKSTQSAALLSHLADNPDVFSALETLPTIPDIQAEIRFLAKGLTAAPTATVAKPEISKARPPVRPVTGAPHTAVEPDPDSSFDEYAEFHNAREARQR